MTDVTYGSYLALDEILALQHPRSEHPDELLFIIVHQSSELWFKEILHEMDLLIGHLTRHQPDFALFRMGRINALMRIVSAQLAALDTLPPQQRAIVVLRYFDDYSEAATADLLGVSTGTVKSTASRAVAQLRTHPGLTALFTTSDTP